MPQNTIKDYYQTLEVSINATTDDIKKSFRRLAHVYHPDKNTTNTFAEARFREIHEAYTVLSNESKRAAYDNERWLSGRFKKNAALLTPQYFLAEMQKLNRHLAEVDVYRMNKQLLQEYLLFLLSADKAAIIIQHGDTENILSITKEITKAISYLPSYFALPVLARFGNIASISLEAAQIILSETAKIKKAQKWQKIYPWLVVTITLFILIAMYYFSKK